MRRLLRDAPDIQAEILVLPHHGAASSMSPAFYDAVRPDAAIASCGFRNAWGFPSAAVRQALDARGISLLTTAMSGQITVEWDHAGERAQVRTARPVPR